MQYTYKNIAAHEAQVNNLRQKYSVLIPIVTLNDKDYILYQVRAAHMRRQPNEISFPGGRAEANELPVDTAVRECCEELGIARDKIDVIGEIDYIYSTHHDMIRCFVARLNIDDVSELNVNKDEVDHIFTVPVDYLMTHPPQEYRIGLVADFPEGFPFDMVPHGKNYDWDFNAYMVNFYTYDDYIIWGLTAKFTRQFIDLINEK